MSEESVEMVTLSVKALQQLLARKDTGCFWINLPYNSEARFHRVIRIVDQRRYDNGDVELYFVREEDGREVEHATVMVSEVFGLAANVAKLIQQMAQGTL